MFLDEYLVGRAVRLSREAPVPVLERTHSFALPGGACNPAHNVASLGSRAVMAGVVGQPASAFWTRCGRLASIPPVWSWTPAGRRPPRCGWWLRACCARRNTWRAST